MPFTLYDADISGDGSADFGGNQRVLYVAWDVLALGSVAHAGTGVITDAIIGLGGFALGDQFDIVGGSPVNRWHETVWFNQTFGLWTPMPAADATGFLSAVATRIKWSVALGGSLHIRVFGDA